MPNTYATGELQRLLGIKGGDVWEVVPAVQPTIDVSKSAAVPELPVPSAWGGLIQSLLPGVSRTYGFIQSTGRPIRIRQMQIGPFVGGGAGGSAMVLGVFPISLALPGAETGAQAVTLHDLYPATPVGFTAGLTARDASWPTSARPAANYEDYGDGQSVKLLDVYVPGGSRFVFGLNDTGDRVIWRFWADEVPENPGPA